MYQPSLYCELPLYCEAGIVLVIRHVALVAVASDKCSRPLRPIIARYLNETPSLRFVKRWPHFRGRVPNIRPL